MQQSKIWVAWLNLHTSFVHFLAVVLLFLVVHCYSVCQNFVKSVRLQSVSDVAGYEIRAPTSSRQSFSERYLY